MASKRTIRTTKAAPRSTRPVSRTTRTVKKAPVKTTTTRPVRQETTASTETPRRTAAAPRSMRFKKSYLILALAALLLIGLLYAGRSLIVAATVNGEPIFRPAVVSELERQSGKQTLDSLVTKSLILQEAKKKNVQVTDQQIDEELKKIEANLKQQGQELDQVLSMQGLTRESLRDQVRIQKIVETLLGREIVVTDNDVAEYIASNSASLPADMPEATLKTNVKQQLRQQKLSERFQSWLQELRQGSKINYLVNY